LAQHSSITAGRAANGIDSARAALLSGVAGYVDAAGFLALFGLLPSHVTAGLVSAGAALSVKHDLPLIAPLCMIPLFMASVAGTALLARALRRRGIPTLAPLFALMTAALSTCCLCGVVFGTFPEGAGSWKLVFVAGTAVAAMGIQNAMMRGSLGHLCPTTVMTGNLAQLTIDLVDWVLLRRDATFTMRQRRKAVGQRLARFGVPVLSFVIGSLLGACVTRRFGLLSVALPVLVLGGLTFIAWHEDAPRSAPARRANRQAASGTSPFPRAELASRPEL
jgi:uncharacterized membrane protein YoaK (UPF0700 family)